MVGVDGSAVGLEAVDWAAEEAARHGVPLQIVHVSTLETPAAESVVDAALERAALGAPGAVVSSEVVTGADPASELTERGRNAFAIVLGSRGLGGLAGLLVGSVSLATAARADCPVVVVRGDPAHRSDRFRAVILGIDAGEGSGTAARFAYREAHVRHCALVAIHAGGTPVAEDPDQPTAVTGEAATDPVFGEGLHSLEVSYPEVVVDRRVTPEDARKALLAAASTADLLVVGARRRVGHFGLQLGLVNHGVLHHSPCPVAIVPQI
ncbi:universal stress protein [Streptomyces sp. NPDC018031]|uniref:universal stress protein n=1 Tax=Streptomyces sp. NPDC018031 TaxID=3365033 RepID=UPI0037A4FC33